MSWKTLKSDIINASSYIKDIKGSVLGRRKQINWTWHLCKASTHHFIVD